MTALREAQAEERAEGALLTVGFYVESEARYLKLVNVLADTLRGAEGVVSETVQSMRQYPCQPFENGPKMMRFLHDRTDADDIEIAELCIFTGAEIFIGDIATAHDRIGAIGGQ